VPLTLIIAARVFGPPMRKWEWFSAAAMTAGLGVLLFLLQPSAGRSDCVPWYFWVAGIGANLAVVGALVALARRCPHSAPVAPTGPACWAWPRERTSA
jgi:hypothetical protein